MHCDDATERLATLMAELCRREGLDEPEIDDVIDRALGHAEATRAPGPTPLLRDFRMAG